MCLSLAVALLGVTRADVTIDLSKAELDTESGNYCVIQKVRGKETKLCCFTSNKTH